MKKLGLALSGGGFRAAAFHLGTLRKLQTLGILDKVEVLSTISGGSITGALYALNIDNFTEFEKKLRTGLKKSMLTTSWLLVGLVGPILLVLPFFLAYWAWWALIFYIPIILLFIKYQFNILPLGKLIEKRYGTTFYGKNELQDLPDKPLLAINSTNVETGRPFTFSREKMNDSFYEYPGAGKKPILFKHKLFPVSRAVMASTCVPFAFTPVKIGKQYFKDKKDIGKIDPTLIDGGVYDNQGIHKLSHPGSSYECGTIIVSDAGTGFKPVTKMNNTLVLLIQTSNLFMNRIKNIQFMGNVILNKYLGNKAIAYFSLGYEPISCINYFVDYLKDGKIITSVIHSHDLTEKDVSKMDKEYLKSYIKDRIGYSDLEKSFPSREVLEQAKNVGTNLTSLSDQKIDALVGVAEALTELQVRLYCPDLLK
ncbi:hypothetical protein DMA11_07815 [Marinilabiliaceae bacterium JC017]|nr:hypothetical protein DMA11_07815 [Marinilabiliaceae bacterium JC017]